MIGQREDVLLDGVQQGVPVLTLLGCADAVVTRKKVSSRILRRCVMDKLSHQNESSVMGWLIRR